jgi:hypothetical protein
VAAYRIGTDSAISRIKLRNKAEATDLVMGKSVAAMVSHLWKLLTRGRFNK